MNVIAIVMARSGSKRLKHKNIQQLGGKPLLAWSVEVAKNARTVDRVIFSSDSPRYIEIAEEYGAEAPFIRPETISEDVDNVLVLQHAVKFLEEEDNYESDYIVMLQPTSPFRKAEDIDACVNELSNHSWADSIVSVCDIQQHPLWSLKLEGSYLKPFIKKMKLKGDLLVSQNLPKVYYPNGSIYVMTRHLLRFGRIYGDKCLPYIMPLERSIDIETSLDLDIARCLAKKWKEGTNV